MNQERYSLSHLRPSAQPLFSLTIESHDWNPHCTGFPLSTFTYPCGNEQKSGEDSKKYMSQFIYQMFLIRYCDGSLFFIASSILFQFHDYR